MSGVRVLAATVSAAIAALAGSASSRPEIGPGAFGPGVVTVNFDNLQGGQTIFTGELVTTQYQHLGVVFVNPTMDSRANSNLAALFGTQSDPNLCFNFQGGGSVPGTPPLELRFSVPVNKVGMWFGTSAASTCKIEVFGAGGVFLESLVKRGQPLGSFGLEGFIGIERTEEITLVKVSSASDTLTAPFNFSIDDVRFEGQAACYPDCDTSTGPGVLDIFDFLCFQNRYDAGASYACDCDVTTGPGTCDIFDFLCFQNAFDAGCP